jgi:hypothetical protein
MIQRWREARAVARRLVLVAAAALAVAAVDRAPARAGVGGGAAFGINLVRLVGVLGVDRAPNHIMETILLAGKREIPFSVIEAQKMSGAPQNGVGVLMPMGPGVPRIRVVGESAFLKPIENALPGTQVTIVGNLITGMRYLELMGVDLPPTTGSARS